MSEPAPTGDLGADTCGVDVSYADPAWFEEPAERAAAMAVLDDDERARMSRFHFDRDRRLYLAAHALLRRALTRRLPSVSPAAWRFDRDAHGKPRVVGPHVGPHVSLSHGAGLVACAVTEGDPVGIDVEPIGAIPEELVDRILAPPEAAALRALPIEAQATRFFTLWTLKEAYVKARGLGLSLPVEQAAFEIEGDAIRFAPGPALSDGSVAWTFAMLRPTPGHCGALCVPVGAIAITQAWLRA